MCVSEERITVFPGRAAAKGEAPSNITYEDVTEAAVRRQVCRQADTKPCTALVLAPYISQVLSYLEPSCSQPGHKPSQFCSRKQNPDAV